VYTTTITSSFHLQCLLTRLSNSTSHLSTSIPDPPMLFVMLCCVFFVCLCVFNIIIIISWPLFLRYSIVTPALLRSLCLRRLCACYMLIAAVVVLHSDCSVSSARVMVAGLARVLICNVLQCGPLLDGMSIVHHLCKSIV